MPNIYVRTQPKTGLKTRHRCGMGFTDHWKELTDIDDATRAALEEDPYLEVSETPTVLVEVSAVVEQPVEEAVEQLVEQPVEELVEQAAETTSKKTKKAAD